MGKLFGTDGIRGIANAGLDVTLAFKAGYAIAQVLSEQKNGKPTVYIGKDTRISSDMLQAALTAGLCAAGADAVGLGVISTPAVAKMTCLDGADAGIVISASHNPFEHNGIKVFGAQGYKLSDEVEEKVESIILSENEYSFKTHEKIGTAKNADDMTDRYVAELLKTAEEDLKGLKVAVDCANGASSATAEKLFNALGVDCTIINAAPNGVNINTDCGSTHLGQLQKLMADGNYDIGFAFDGDADRCLAVDEKGEAIDGDKIMGLCAAELMDKGELPGNALVATVMSNLGLHKFAESKGMKLVCTDVGDRHVLEKMIEKGYIVGGEQSGHIIFTRCATTGDGQLAAIKFMSLLKRSGKKASQLSAMVPVYPQVLINVPSVSDRQARKDMISSKKVQDAVHKFENSQNFDGRILIRPSGTEALIRVMVEASTEEIAENVAKELAELIKI